MAAVTLKRWYLKRIIGPVGKPQGMFQPKALTHARAFCDQTVIKRGGFLHAPLGQGFIGERHHKTPLVVFRRFDCPPIGGCPITKTGDIHRPDVD